MAWGNEMPAMTMLLYAISHAGNITEEKSCVVCLNFPLVYDYRKCVERESTSFLMMT
jgi:hypothetical protein